MILKIVIDNGGLVTDEVAVRMALQVLERDEGTLKFSDGYGVEIRVAKTQKSFKVVTLREEE